MHYSVRNGFWKLTQNSALPKMCGINNPEFDASTWADTALHSQLRLKHHYTALLLQYSEKPHSDALSGLVWHPQGWAGNRATHGTLVTSTGQSKCLCTWSHRKTSGNAPQNLRVRDKDHCTRKTASRIQCRTSATKNPRSGSTVCAFDLGHYERNMSHVVAPFRSIWSIFQTLRGWHVAARDDAGLRYRALWDCSQGMATAEGRAGVLSAECFEGFGCKR